ncbi:hypothetical protein GGQ63_001905 [Prosthecomicrobium pneumaticum]|uniref:Uncharacterized protein n=1 Tax=Prosthecomicrobium pneumaticum TaxID=81895 RepID=A0A7W9FLH0_9HYPH|nr:hypothetical protein [Prosthecomicrobium pneumaticum]
MTGGGRPRSIERHDYGCRHGGRHDGGGGDRRAGGERTGRGPPDRLSPRAPSPPQSTRHPGLRAGVHNRDAGREGAPSPSRTSLIRGARSTDTGSIPRTLSTRHPREGEDPSRRTVLCCMDSRLRRNDGVGRTGPGAPAVTIMDAGTEAGMTGGGRRSQSGKVEERENGPQWQAPSRRRAPSPPQSTRHPGLRAGVHNRDAGREGAPSPSRTSLIRGARSTDTGPIPRTLSTRHPREGEDPSRRAVRCCMDSRLRGNDGGGRPRSTERHDYGCRHGGRHDGWGAPFAEREGRGARERTAVAGPFKTHSAVAAPKHPSPRPPCRGP